MTTSEILERYRRLESDISKEKGDFNLFALFLREDVPDRWDLIVAAPWISDKSKALDYFVGKIKSQLGIEDLTNLSRIVFVDPADIAVSNLNRAIDVKHGDVELRDSNIFGLPVKHAFIITSKKPLARAAG